MKKIFGIGWAKTGTTTLGQCFKILGYDHQSQDLELVKYIESNEISKIIAVARNKETFEDWPWIILYYQMDQRFLNSKVILTIRGSDKQLIIYRNMRRTLCGLPLPDVTSEELKQRYIQHD